MKNALKFAVIQDGYCVFGAGATANEAYADAAQWLDRRDDGSRYTADMVEEECDSGNRSRIDGDLRLISRAEDRERFDDYMENQGGFEIINGEWFAKE
jgi:hypothetical protein